MAGALFRLALAIMTRLGMQAALHNPYTRDSDLQKIADDLHARALKAKVQSVTTGRVRQGRGGPCAYGPGGQPGRRGKRQLQRGRGGATAGSCVLMSRKGRKGMVAL